ncbi:polysaccharide pyruvyl transferase family protein [Croceicoccus marinus]|nr:polysaccharide pyruvyl transferase family protein [Croceicoccus marinus]
MPIGNQLRRMKEAASIQPETILPFLAQRIGTVASAEMAKRKGGYVSHYGAWHGNAGDVMIAFAEHALFDNRFGKQSWLVENHQRKVTHEDVERINASARAVVVGGGGLIIPDHYRYVENTDSDWQWNISLSDLAAIRRPLLGFALGYNRMAGQADFKPFFRDHIAAVVDQSVFFGLRNGGSIARLSDYLPPHLHSRLSLQPCPTNLMSMIRPESWAATRDPQERSVTFVLFMGFQRLGLVEKSENIRRIGDLAKRLHRDGWTIHVATHTAEELAAVPMFRKAGVPFTLKMLDMMSPEGIAQYYRSKSLVIGMRGHGVMLPYGLGVPVMGIINHVKVRYFLEEVKLGDYAVDLEDPHMTDKMIERVGRFDADRPAFYRVMDREKERLWDITQRNLDTLEPYFRQG